MHACRGVALVFLNGAILGIHARPKRLVAAFRQLRRAGRIGEFVSVWAQVEACIVMLRMHAVQGLLAAAVRPMSMLTATVALRMQWQSTGRTKCT
jgi:hypothetical protein